MRTKLTLAAFALLAGALVVLAVACDGAGAGVTVEKGLAAAVGQDTSGGIDQASTTDSASYAAAIAEKEEAARAAYTGAAYPPTAAYPVGGMGGESLSVSPQLQAQGGITVQGYGRATAPADAARVQFVVSKSGEVYPTPVSVEPRAVPGVGVDIETEPAMPPDEYPTPVPPSPITEADLEPLIDAIKGEGFSDSDIEITIYSSGYYYDPYGSGSARVTVTVDNPADEVEPLVEAATEAVNESGTLMLQNVGVMYTVDDCDDLLAAARRVAVEDGRDNGAGLAEALDVGLGDVVAASEYIYSPFGPSSCDPSFDTYYAGPYGYEGMAYDPVMPAEVQIVANVTLTFAMS
ncbi:MAG: hypothetical protein AMJ77_02885 [Dehalococcoidia bacterium SM23_28_2]|nr:MAG: hypothetical protein AMJ77_02885 [Dehalococcoidia bacterium SM23_28_2]